jgi:hypothetical protein
MKSKLFRRTFTFCGDLAILIEYIMLHCVYNGLKFGLDFFKFLENLRPIRRIHADELMPMQKPNADAET